jgi:hypothetical protein
MADNKVTRSRKTRKQPDFSEVKGKIVEGIELKPSETDTQLESCSKTEHFSVSMLNHTIPVFHELSDWKPRITGH